MRGEGSLYERNGIWYGQFYVNGRRVQRSTRQKTRKAAEKVLWKWVEGSREGTYTRASTVDLKALTDRVVVH